MESHNEHEQTLTLLEILALGDKQIEAGKFRSADEVFAELDKKHRGAKEHKSIAETLSIPEVADIDFKPPRLRRKLYKPADLLVP